MDQVSIAKSELRFQQWTELIADRQSSGMTVKAWCALHDINIKTYYYWLRKIRKQALDNSPVPVSNTLPAANKEPISFKKLEVKSPVSGMQAAVIVHLPQATLEVAQGTDQQTVEAVLLALKAVC
jgi:transposase-like protein